MRIFDRLLSWLDTRQERAEMARVLTRAAEGKGQHDE